MGLKTINHVSKDYGTSAGTLRYYERAELIRSGRKEDYAYRLYDEAFIKFFKPLDSYTVSRFTMTHGERKEG